LEKANNTKTWFPKGRQFLIVDDDLELRKYLVELFKVGFTVFDCSNGEKALKLAKEFQPDYLL
jgi:DNA-binding response OmpR family regulator